jgi:type IV pilus assembly protein PilE
MEQFFQDNHFYFQAAIRRSVHRPAPPTRPPAYFNFSCPTLTATTYTLTATGKSSMTGFTYTVDQANVRTSPLPARHRPAGRTCTATCWVTSKGGGC